MAYQYCSFQETQARHAKCGRLLHLPLGSSISRLMLSQRNLQGGLLSLLIFMQVSVLLSERK